MQRAPGSVKSRGAGRAVAAALIAAVALGGAAALSGCDSTKRARPRGVSPTGVTRDVPAVLRNTIGAQATLRGVEPTLATGYGVVVGLNGTGSSDVPVAIRAMLEREMRVRGVGQETLGMGWVSPAQMLNDPNTAVVFVQASVPPGAAAGTAFDVLVEALPGTSTTSLEGGRLWTTELRPGVQLPGGPAVSSIATAKGEVFINPFADPAREGEDSIVRTVGRILGGGSVSRGQDLTLVLDSPSHARARSIVNAINTKFPQGPGDRERIARGVNEEYVAINVPARFRKNTEEFVQLLLHLRVDQLFAREWAVRYERAIREETSLAEDLSWCLQALGEVAIPALRELYDYPEVRPRFAALRAGARLGDPMTTPHLKELAERGPSGVRLDAISLLGDMGPDPGVNMALRSLLVARDLDVRIAAYEALARRFEPALTMKPVAGKFRLDMVEAAEPMVYISQQGEPRIVLFGERPELVRPAFIKGWSDRLMLNAETVSDPMRVYYLDHTTGRARTSVVDARLSRFVEFLAHDPSPEDPSPGLGLTYSGVVGALHEIWKGGGIRGAFVAEQDRLAAELLRSLTPMEMETRPEFAGEQASATDETRQTQGDRRDADERPAQGEAQRPVNPYIVPIPTRPPSKGDGGR